MPEEGLKDGGDERSWAGWGAPSGDETPSDAGELAGIEKADGSEVVGEEEDDGGEDEGADEEDEELGGKERSTGGPNQEDCEGEGA